MTLSALEKRVAALEQELAALRRTIDIAGPAKPWWERLAGTFEHDPVYERAMRLGREYRDSLKPAKRSGRKK